MLAPHAVDIAVTISSLIAYYVSHLPNHSTTFFSSSSEVVHWSAEIQTKVYNPRKEGSTNRSTKRVNLGSLTKLLFLILQNSRKNESFLAYCVIWPRRISASDKVIAFPVHCVCKFVSCNFKPKQWIVNKTWNLNLWWLLLQVSWRYT